MIRGSVIRVGVGLVGSRCWSTRQSGGGLDWQHLGRSRRLGEVEVVAQIAQERGIFAHVWSRIGTTIARGVDALPIQKVVFDELVVRVEAQGLMVNVALFGIRTDSD